MYQYKYEENIDILKSINLRDAFQLASLTSSGARWVEFYANAEHPPRAVNRALDTENCQGWTVRVLERLAAQGVVTTDWIISVKAMLEPIR